MKIAAIICEYMPFHNGHARHIALTHEAGYDIVICIMDGHVSQRGDFSPLSRESRARAALLNGADMVVEMPSLFACRTADVFARAGVEIADILGADALSFGSETGDIELLAGAAEMVESSELKEALARGEAYPRALGSVNAPNDILAIEYIKALKNTTIAPFTIKREGDYHSDELGEFASASAIRSAVRRNDMSVKNAVPANARFQFEDMRFSDLEGRLKLAAVRYLMPEGINKLPDINEGLENLVYEAADCPDFEEAIMKAKCKRYTFARLNRIFAHAMTGLTGELAEKHGNIEYVRLIGYRDNGTVKEVSRRMKLPFARSGELKHNEIFAFENRVTDLWALTRGEGIHREYYSKVIRL